MVEEARSALEDDLNLPRKKLLQLKVQLPMKR